MLSVSAYCSCGLVVRTTASPAGGRGFDPQPRQPKVFKTGSRSLPLGIQDYRNSDTTGPPVSV